MGKDLFLEVHWGFFKCLLDLGSGMSVSKAVHHSEPMMKHSPLCLSCEVEIST